MWLYYFAILLTITANLFYHIVAKSVPGNVNPIISLIATYITALIVCIIILPFAPNDTTLMESFRKLNWTSYAMGLAVVGLELGFLLAYRAGWHISFAAIFTNVTVTIIIIPIGILMFKESLSIINILGIVLCAGGLVLINCK